MGNISCIKSGMEAGQISGCCPCKQRSSVGQATNSTHKRTAILLGTPASAATGNRSLQLVSSGVAN